MLTLSSYSDKMDILPSSLSNPSHQGYISELLSFSLDRLHKEPELLRVDAERIRRQMQDLAVANYRSFISAAEALHTIGEEMTSVDKHLESVIFQIPELTGGCNIFMESGQQVLEKRNLNQMLLANHSTILDLLEIPQLMDTCVRNGNYDEALDLETFVSKLATLHAKLPVIQSLVAEVKQITQSMLLQLLQRLRSNIQLPECLRVIGYLRRLGVFTEHEIRLQFLRCRDSWLAGIIDDLEQGNTYDYLKRIADCHRVHLFDVVTQYRAIFTDDTSGNEERFDGGLLYSWAMHRITLYLSVLQTLLPKITDGMSLATLLEQCMYCGMSLGRVGMDFRGLLLPLFEVSVCNLFSSNVTVAVENFQLALDSHRWISLPSVGLGSRGTSDGTDNISPPYVLMEHPPLATFVNGLLVAMNELRHCAPLSLKKILALELKRTLQSVSDYLYYFNSSSRLIKDDEISLFMGMCRTFIEVACPYCISCFQRCYPGSKIDSKEILEKLQQYFYATSFPRPHSNGVLALSSAPITNDDKQEPSSGVPVENGGAVPEENGAELVVNEANIKDNSNQADSDDVTGER